MWLFGDLTPLLYQYFISSTNKRYYICRFLCCCLSFYIVSFQPTNVQTIAVVAILYFGCCCFCSLFGLYFISLNVINASIAFFS